MSSNPSYQQFGLEAMNTCFISPEAPPFFFQPNMPQDGSFGLGDPAGADATPHFAASNATMITSPANQLVWAAPSQDSHYHHHTSMSPEEMSDAYAVASESCSTVHSMIPAAAGSTDFFQYGPSDVTIAQPSKMARLTGEPHCSWIYDGPSAAFVHEPSYLAAFSGATGFSNPLAAAASELSLRLGARCSSVTMVDLPEQSSEVSCSGLTHVNSDGFGYQHPQPVKAHAGIGIGTGTGTGMFQLPPYGDAGAGAGDGELRHAYPQPCPRPRHFSQVLSRSRYAHVAQELLNGFAGCLLKDVAEASDNSVISAAGSEASPLLLSTCSTRTPSSVSSNQLMMFPSDEHRHDDAAAAVDVGGGGGGRWVETQKLRNDLLKLLQLMDQRCNRCFDDVQTAASRFSTMVAHPCGGGGGRGGIPVPPFAHRAVLVVYRRLRKRITGLIMAVVAQSSGCGETSSPSSSSLLADKERSWESSFIQKHWALQQLRRGDQQSWRPQRGLPEKSVAVLKAWMFENFLRPYPKDNEKEMLAARSGLSRSQVSNWFINARVRLWKPMIEEMYEELKRTSGGGEVERLSSKDVVS